MEVRLEEQLKQHLSEEGWNLYSSYKIRGLRPDLLIGKSGKLAAIQVRVETAHLDNTIKKALHFKNALNCSYLAMPDYTITKMTTRICRELGIGLISVGDKSREITGPEETKALDSIKNKVFQLKPKKLESGKRGQLETLFRSRTFACLLGHLFLNGSREYYLNELAQETGVPAATILKEIDKIDTLGILNKKARRRTYYSINKDCIIYEELRRIFLKIGISDKIIKKNIEKFDIKFALIFGSFARGTETDESDIDFLIVGKVDEESLLQAVAKTQNTIKREINYVLWNEKEFQEKIKRRISLLKNIKENDIIMIRGDENEFKRFIEK